MKQQQTELSLVLNSTFKPSPQQQTYFDWIINGVGSAIIVAVAGAGKTTTIVTGCSLMTGNIALLAFNAKMAEELIERVKHLKNLRASTFHSAGFTALRFALGKQFKLQLEKVRGEKVRSICEATANNREDEEERAILHALIPGVIKIVSMAKNRGIGTYAGPKMNDEQAWIDMIQHYDLEASLPENARMDQVIKFAQVALSKSNKNLDMIDFDDMIYLPIQRDIRMFPNDWVLVDEAQDTNAMRRALARKMLKPNGRLVAVGDPCQAIFGFTGADNDSLEQIERDFKCVRLPLTVTYRCPKAVVRHARQWVSHIEAHESAPEGRVETIKYEELMNTVQPGDAVLCRYNKYLAILVFKLIRAGIPAKIEGRSIGEGLIRMCDRWKVKTLEALRNKIELYFERELQKAIDRNNEVKIDQLTDECETMYVLIARAQDQHLLTVAELKVMIEGMFADNVSDKNIVTLCSVHKAKGLEWNRVFILGRGELMPSRNAKLPWNHQQEIHLIYVACTRAKEVLYEVEGITVMDREKNHAPLPR